MSSYTYSISQDCPGGLVNITKLQIAIQSSPIITAIDHIDTHEDDLIIYFRANLSNTDQNILDGGSGSPYGTHPAGGLIASTDNTPNIQSPSLVSGVKPINYNRRYGFSPNFTDQTTWWEQAIKVTNENIGTGDGVTTIFNLTHGNATVVGEAILDLEHGKITEEDYMIPSGGVAGDYNVKISINGVSKTQREAFESSGGDFIIDYLEGKVTFYSAPANGLVITCTYWYIPNNVGPSFTMLPSDGHQLIIDDIECSFSSDVEQLDTMQSGAWLNSYQMWAPISRNPTSYKTILDFFNYTCGAYPTVPAIGTNSRGFPQTSVTLRWDFKSYVIFNAGDTGSPAFRIDSKHNRKPFSGMAATLTIYALEIPLTNKIS